MSNQSTVGVFSDVAEALKKAIQVAGGLPNIAGVTIVITDEPFDEDFDVDEEIEEVDDDEEDPEELETMCFARAFVAMRNGLAMARLRWDHDNRIRVQTECKGHECTMPFLVNTNGFDAVPWTPSQDDLFADDWYIYK